MGSCFGGLWAVFQFQSCRLNAEFANVFVWVCGVWCVQDILMRRLLASLLVILLGSFACAANIQLTQIPAYGSTSDITGTVSGLPSDGTTYYVANYLFVTWE